jgi:hypothetical protein
MRISPFILMLSIIGCAEYSVDMTNADALAEELEKTRSIRIDVTPSDASAQLLPQSFFVLPDDTWLDLSLFLKPTVMLSGNVHGYSIYPYFDIIIPGEDVPVEAQIQISQPNAINGGLINSDIYGNFTVSIPQGDQYQLSVSPLSPQNVPYTIVDNLDFTQVTPQLEVDLGIGTPVYGQILGFSDHQQEATAQLIDTLTGLKGPQIDIAENGYFQLRAPTNRSDFTIRIQGANNDLIPMLDILIRIEDDDTDGFQLEIDMGDIIPINVSGQLEDPEGVAYSERAVIRFQSIELYNADGNVFVETNNDFNGQFSVNLLEGRYKVDFIPPFIESEEVSPVSMEIEVLSPREQLEQIRLKEQVLITAVVIAPDGLPASNVNTTFRDVNFDQYTYSGTTDESGRLDIMLPPVLMDVTLHPTNGIGAVTNFQTDISTFNEEFEWSLQNGEYISGTILFEEETVPFSLIEIYQGDQLLANGLSGPSGEFELQIQVEE